MSELPTRQAMFARRNPDGMRYEAAGLDYEVAPIAEFKKRVGHSLPSRARDRSVRAASTEPHEIAHVRSCESTSSSKQHEPDVEDIILVFLDLFARYPEDTPTRTKSGPVKSPLLLVSTWPNLRDYVRRKPKAFPDAPPRRVVLTDEERRKMDEDYKRLFGN